MTATLSRKQAATFLGISTRTLDELVTAGSIPSLMLGGRRLFRRETLERRLVELEAKAKRPNLRAVT